MTLTLFKRYLKILISYYSGFPVFKPDSVSLAITDRCNLKCKMCDYWKQNKENKNPLNLKEYEELFKDLARYKVKRIQFTGGEPLLRPDLLDILYVAKSNGFEISLITNGTLINEIKGKDLIELVDTIDISLDSPYPDIHDSIRGVPGTFHKTTRTIKLLSNLRKEIGREVKITVCSVITNSGLHNPKEMLLLLKELGADRLIYNPASSGPYGYSHLKDDFAIEANKMAEYDKMIDQIIESMNKNGVMIKSNPFYLESSKNFLRGNKQFFHFPCYSGAYNAPLINYDGEVFPCCAWNLSIGNLKEKPFSHIWKSEEAKKVRRLIKKKRCPMCHHHTRTFDYVLRAPLLTKNPLHVWRGYQKFF